MSQWLSFERKLYQTENSTVFGNALRRLIGGSPASASSGAVSATNPPLILDKAPIGLIAGSGALPIQFARGAHTAGHPVIAVCHKGESEESLPSEVDVAVWLKIGELGKIISTFKAHGVTKAVMAGGVNRVRLFGGVKLDVRGAQLLAKLRSTKDDVLMRGIASELEREGIQIVESTLFLEEWLVPLGQLTKRVPNEEQEEDIRVGVAAVKAMSSEHIGQTVVVKEGVVVSVEAVEGTDRAIRRGGELGGKGSVVVKFAKLNQDMRFDVPVVGTRTIATMRDVGAHVLAVEAGRCLFMEPDRVLEEAERAGIVVVGCAPLGKPLASVRSL